MQRRWLKVTECLPFSIFGDDVHSLTYPLPRLFVRWLCTKKSQTSCRGSQWSFLNVVLVRGLLWFFLKLLFMVTAVTWMLRPQVCVNSFLSFRTCSYGFASIPEKGMRCNEFHLNASSSFWSYEFLCFFWLVIRWTTAAQLVSDSSSRGLPSFVQYKYYAFLSYYWVNTDHPPISPRHHIHLSSLRFLSPRWSLVPPWTSSKRTCSFPPFPSFFLLLSLPVQHSWTLLPGLRGINRLDIQDGIYVRYVYLSYFSIASLPRTLSNRSIPTYTKAIHAKSHISSEVTRTPFPVRCAGHGRSGILLGMLIQVSYHVFFSCVCVH